MSAPTPNNIPAGEFSLPFTILAIQPDELSSRQAESYTVVLLRHNEKPEVRTGLDLEAIGGLAATDTSGSLLAAYGPEDHLTERLWRIAAGIDAVVLDVRLLARILLPGLRDYERATVERCFDPEPAESRDGAAGPAETGTEDALKTAVLCRSLLDLLASQDPDTKETLILLAEGTGTGLERLLARMTARTGRTASRGDTGSRGNHSARSGERPPIAHTALGLPTIGDGSCDAAEADGDLDPMDTEELARLFETGGLFESSMEGYEQRPQQVSMVRSVACAFNEGEVLLVEAGTGTGKSLSYLTPALIWAVRNNQRVIVSTNTRNLQEQLFYKDLPFLLENLGLDFRATLLKGRSNYLCLDRWRQVTRRPADHLTAEEREAAIPLAVWARETQTGDISEHAGFNRGAGAGLWEKINGEGTACPRCVLKEACFVNRVRRAAMASHVVIINHALLFADLQSDHAVLSRYGHLIIDEAHNLERAAVQHLTLEVGGWRMRRVLGRMHAPEWGGTGVLAGLDRLAKKAADNLDWKAPLEAGTRMAIDRITEVNRRIEGFFRIASDEAFGQADDGSARRTKLRYRAEDEYAGILRSSARVLIEGLAGLRESLGMLHATLDQVHDSWLDDRESRGNAIVAAMDFCTAMEEALFVLTEANEGERVYWVEATRSQPLSCVLTAAPLRVADRLHDDLFRPLRTAVLTSATLTVGDRFDYQLERLGLDRIDPRRLQVRGIGSPFDYADQVLVCVPAAFPTPRSDAFQDAVSRLILDLVVSTLRSTLVLFTSYTQLNRTFQDIEPDLAEHGVAVLAQGTSGPRSALLDRFRRSDTAVLLGTDSFWEGVDVPGKALEMVILVKLPFAVPTEPLVQAQVERLEDAGRNSFFEYQVPEAVIKFRQGFGRLIRSTRDYGVVTVLDQRVVGTAYGRLFLESLPAGSEIYPDADGLVEGVTYWFRARAKRRVERGSLIT
ncbi:MAG: DEAD/DEAH box helicase family protein [Gemmatimonadota bacterium]|nr:DEAD/DEAH box helicase family protein [Gemmatimonadota bacterium]